MRIHVYGYLFDAVFNNEADSVRGEAFIEDYELPSNLHSSVENILETHTNVTRIFEDYAEWDLNNMNLRVMCKLKDGSTGTAEFKIRNGYIDKPKIV
jgi:hypothetical protein